MWVKKCKRLWNMEGDENTAFFHKICSARKRSIITSIVDNNGVLCTNNNDIIKAFPRHFENIYRDNGKELWLIENLHWSPIFSMTQEELCKPFIEQEIFLSLKWFSNNKTPRPMDLL